MYQKNRKISLGWKALAAIVGAAVLTAFPLHGQMRGAGGGAGSQGQQQGQMKLQQEFQQISRELQKVQEKAMQTPEVQQAIANAQSTLQSKMIEVAPDKSGVIKRYFKMQSDLRDGGSGKAGPKQQSARQKKVKEIREIQGKIKGAQQKAMQSEEFRNAQQKVQKKMKSAMMEENPKSEKLMQRRRQIIKKVRSNQQRRSPQPQSAPAQGK